MNAPARFDTHDKARLAGLAAYQEAKLQRPWKVVVKTYGTPAWYEWRLVYMTAKHKITCEQYQDTGHWIVFVDHKVEAGEEDKAPPGGYGRSVNSLRDAVAYAFQGLKDRAQREARIAETCGRALKRMRGG